MTTTAAATGIGIPISSATLLASTAASSTRKAISRRPSAADLTPISTTSSPARTTATAASVSPSKHNIVRPPGMKSISTVPNKDLATTDAKLKDSTMEPVSPATATTVVVQCNCPPPLVFPENVKRELKREEEEHRKRECGLYEKIIELQIENANLQGEKETLNRVLSRRDKMLLELQMQLQAMEFVCRENEIKVDIDMCPDEAIENWSFKESDEVYQRILLTTQDLLRTGSKCLEENVVTSRSSSQHQRPTRTSSFATTTSRSSLGGGSTNCSLFENGVAPRRNVVAGLSEGAQPLTVRDQEVDPLLFKETSRPGTLKLDLHTLLRSEQEFNSSNKSKGTVNQGNIAEVDAGIEHGGRRAIDCGDDRSSFFRGIAGKRHQQGRLGIDHVEDEADDDEDDDESEESEFEELGEDMIKFVDLQSSMTPRRESRASSFSLLMPPGGSLSAATTPDLSSAVLMKNMWTANGSARRSASTTPVHHPAHQQHFSQQHHQYQQYPQSHRRSANRSSAGSTLSSSSSLLDDYFTRPQFTYQEQQSAASSVVGLGLGLTGLGRSPEQVSSERFLSTPPRGALPPPPLPSSMPMSLSKSPSPRGHPVSLSPLGGDSCATFPSSHYHHHHHHHPHHSNSNNSNVIRPPPMMPLPPLPSQPRYSYRDHTKSQLLQPKRPTHNRTRSHGFAIENVGQFLKRRTYGKTLTRDTMHRGLRRRDSV
ncbi:hypothetical protein BGX23_011735 [Mortierella sp. AD031]|nr:hypothetical protein BGX23_011735 [Mortierella sp. AD031]